MLITKKEKRGYQPNWRPENFGFQPIKTKSTNDKPVQKSKPKPIPPKGSETTDA